MNRAYTTPVLSPASMSRPRSPYEVALGRAFFALDPQIQRAHQAPLVATGIFHVERGSSWLARTMARLLKLPIAGAGQAVHLQVMADGNELLWTRRIGAVALRTRQSVSSRFIVERHGIGSILFELATEDGALVYRQASFCIAGIPVPRFLAPHVAARVSPTAGGWLVDVLVGWRAHRVCRYGGRMVMA